MSRYAQALAVALTVLLAGPAVAEAGYGATYQGQCCYMVLEPGDTAENWFDFRNTGDLTWYRTGAVPVLLGTAAPYGGGSAFFDASDWHSPGRPTLLDQDFILPGGTGRFTFRIKAPQQTGFYRQAYAPLAEGIAWLACDGCIFLDYTVIPAEPPSIRLTSAPARVRRGDDIPVSVDASDNRGIARVTFDVGGATVSIDAPTSGTQTYASTLKSDGLAPGTHTVISRAYDLGGRESIVTAAFEVYDPPPADGDGDGVPDGSDRCPAARPLSADSDHDGCTDARPATRRFQVAAVTQGGHILRLLVSGAAAGARVSLQCTAGCRANGKVLATTRVPAHGRPARLRVRRAARIRPGVRIEVRAAQSGRRSRYADLRVIRRLPYLKRLGDGCIAADRRTRQPC